MSERDKKLDPRPGDQFVATMLKAKITAVEFKESGITRVSYLLARKDHPYGNHEYSVTLAQWHRFVASPNAKPLEDATTGA